MMKVLPVIAILAYFTPIMILIVRKLWNIKPLMYFSCYWLLNGLVNLIILQNWFAIETTQKLATGLNLVDFPLVAFGIYSIAQSRWVRKLLLIAIILYAIAAVYISIKYAMDPSITAHFIPFGIVLIIITISREIYHYFQKVEHTSKETAIIFILASVVFLYGSFSIIYIFENFLPNIANVTDIYTIYYFSSIIGMLFAILAYCQKGLKK